MKLYLVRHGAYRNHPADPSKPLSPKGEAEVQSMARYLKQREIEWTLILSSPKKRAVQTAQLLKQVLETQASLEQRDFLCPNDDVDVMVGELRERNGHVMIVGHLPYLPELILALTGATHVPLPTSSVVCLERDDASGEGLFQEVITPDMINS